MSDTPFVPPMAREAFRYAVDVELEQARRTGRIAGWVIRCGVWLGPGARCLRPRAHEGACSPTWSST